MLAAQGAVQNLETIRVMAVISALALVLLWRVVIKLLIVILATAVIALIGAGAFVLIESLHG